MNILGTNGPREMRVYIPSVDNNVINLYQPKSNHENLSNKASDVIKLINKQPTWSISKN